MYKKSTFNKTNFALEAMANLDLNACKFFDLLQWEMEGNYDKPSFRLKTTCLQEMGGCKMSKTNIKHTLRKLLTTEIILENSKYSGFKSRNFIYALDIENGYIEVKVDDQLKDKLNINKSKDGYNQHNLSILKLFKGKHGYKLYQYIMMRLNTNKSSYITIKIEDLREFLGCKFSHKEFKYFNLKVLKVAIDEINSISDLHIEYKINTRNLLEIDFKVKKFKSVHEKMAVSEICIPKQNIKPIALPNQLKAESPISKPAIDINTMSAKEIEQNVDLPEYIQEIFYGWKYNSLKELVSLHEKDPETLKKHYDKCVAGYVAGTIEHRASWLQTALNPLPVAQPKTIDLKASFIYQNDTYSAANSGQFTQNPNAKPMCNFETKEQETARKKRIEQEIIKNKETFLTIWNASDKKQEILTQIKTSNSIPSIQKLISEIPLNTLYQDLPDRILPFIHTYYKDQASDLSYGSWNITGFEEAIAL
jgi:hypothetical protein